MSFMRSHFGAVLSFGVVVGILFVGYEDLHTQHLLQKAQREQQHVIDLHQVLDTQRHTLETLTEEANQNRKKAQWWQNQVNETEAKLDEDRVEFSSQGNQKKEAQELLVKAQTEQNQAAEVKQQLIQDQSTQEGLFQNWTDYVNSEIDFLQSQVDQGADTNNEHSTDATTSSKTCKWGIFTFVCKAFKGSDSSNDDDTAPTKQNSWEWLYKWQAIQTVHEREQNDQEQYQALEEQSARDKSQAAALLDAFRLWEKQLQTDQDQVQNATKTAALWNKAADQVDSQVQQQQAWIKQNEDRLDKVKSSSFDYRGSAHEMALKIGPVAVLLMLYVVGNLIVTAQWYLCQKQELDDSVAQRTDYESWRFVSYVVQHGLIFMVTLGTVFAGDHDATKTTSVWTVVEFVARAAVLQVLLCQVFPHALMEGFAATSRCFGVSRILKYGILSMILHTVLFGMEMLTVLWIPMFRCVLLSPTLLKEFDDPTFRFSVLVSWLLHYLLYSDLLPRICFWNSSATVIGTSTGGSSVSSDQLPNTVLFEREGRSDMMEQGTSPESPSRPLPNEISDLRKQAYKMNVMESATEATVSVTGKDDEDCEWDIVSSTAAASPVVSSKSIPKFQHFPPTVANIPDSTFKCMSSQSLPMVHAASEATPLLSSKSESVDTSSDSLCRKDSDSTTHFSPRTIFGVGAWYHSVEARLSTSSVSVSSATEAPYEARPYHLDFPKELYRLWIVFQVLSAAYTVSFVCRCWLMLTHHNVTVSFDLRPSTAAILTGGTLTVVFVSWIMSILLLATKYRENTSEPKVWGERNSFCGGTYNS